MFASFFYDNAEPKTEAATLGQSSDHAPAFWTARGPPPLCESYDNIVVFQKNRKF
jgi:hypothetical protein